MFDAERDEKLIQELYTPMRPLVEAVLACINNNLRMRASEVEAHLAAAWRSHRSQWDKYRKGRRQDGHGRWYVFTGGEKTVTNATPFEAPHCVQMKDGQPCSMAVDIALVKAGAYLAKGDHQYGLWGLVPGIAALHAPDQIRPGFDWKLRDFPHLQWRGWRDLSHEGYLLEAPDDQP